MSADNLLSPRANALADQVSALRRELAAAQEARLAAKLRAEGLQRALQEIADALRTVYKGSDSGLPALALRRRALALLAAPPVDLGPLRDLVRAIAEWEERLTADQDSRGNAEMRLMEKRDAAVAAYPALDPGAEPAGEMPTR